MRIWTKSVAYWNEDQQKYVDDLKQCQYFDYNGPLSKAESDSGDGSDGPDGSDGSDGADGGSSTSDSGFGGGSGTDSLSDADTGNARDSLSDSGSYDSEHLAALTSIDNAISAQEKINSLREKTADAALGITGNGITDNTKAEAGLAMGTSAPGSTIGSSALRGLITGGLLSLVMGNPIGLAVGAAARSGLFGAATGFAKDQFGISTPSLGGLLHSFNGASNSSTPSSQSSGMGDSSQSDRGGSDPILPNTLPTMSLLQHISQPTVVNPMNINWGNASAQNYSPMIAKPTPQYNSFLNPNISNTPLLQQMHTNGSALLGAPY